MCAVVCCARCDKLHAGTHSHTHTSWFPFSTQTINNLIDRWIDRELCWPEWLLHVAKTKKDSWSCLPYLWLGCLRQPVLHLPLCCVSLKGQKPVTTTAGRGCCLAFFSFLFTAAPAICSVYQLVLQLLPYPRRLPRLAGSVAFSPV